MSGWSSIRAYKDAVDIPIIAGITGEGTKVAAEEAKRSLDAGATGALVYPNHGWLRFGFQKGAPQDRYKAIYEEGGLQTILFQYPDATKASYDLDTQAGDCGAAGLRGHQERRAQHEALVCRDPRA
ncbi:hypothetical protein FALB51S_00106 [Frigidibacter albus]